MEIRDFKRDQPDRQIGTFWLEHETCNLETLFTSECSSKFKHHADRTSLCCSTSSFCCLCCHHPGMRSSLCIQVHSLEHHTAWRARCRPDQVHIPALWGRCRSDRWRTWRSRQYQHTWDGGHTDQTHQWGKPQGTGTHLKFRRNQPCTRSCQWSRASCRHRCTHQTTDQMSRCTPQQFHQHRRRKCGTHRGRGESRIHWDGDRGHLGPLEAGGQDGLHSLHWSNGHKAPSSLRMGQTPNHQGRDDPRLCHQDSHNICHTGRCPQNTHPSLDIWNLTGLL